MELDGFELLLLLLLLKLLLPSLLELVRLEEADPSTALNNEDEDGIFELDEDGLLCWEFDLE